MFAQVELSLGGVKAHVLFIVYALNAGRNGVAEQAVGADGHTSSRARRMCAISLCTRGALDSAARRRSTAALCGNGGRVPIDGDLWTACALSGALLVVSFWLWPPPRGSVVIGTTLAIVIPI